MVSPKLAAITNWGVLSDLHGSDHFPIITTVTSGSSQINTHLSSKFLTDRADWECFQSNATQFLTNRESSSSVNQEAATIQRAIRYAANLAIPQTHKCTKKVVVPWWSKEIHILRQNKQELWKKFKKFPNDTHLIAYRKANALFRKAAKLAKKASFEQFTSNINPKATSKKLWTDVKTLTGNYVPYSINVINAPPLTLSNPLQISEHFAKTWSSYSSDSNFSPEFINSKSSATRLLPTSSDTDKFACFIERPITTVEFESSLRGSKGKSPGYDRISYIMLKNSPQILKHRMLALYNEIFTQGIIPQNWKTATIIPISKPTKSPSEVNGYRPISLLPCPAKILERITAKRLLWFLESKNLIDTNQVAFRHGRCTTDALLHIDQYVASALSTKNHVSILSIDFEKAFDRIGAHIILDKLVQWKIGPKMFYFIKSFLMNRKFRLKLNSTYSSLHNLDNGIPQGSPLSVILFIIAFNDLSVILKKYRTIGYSLYADDLIIFTKCKCLTEVSNVFYNILTDLNNWCKASGSKISLEKCKLLHICKKTSCSKNISVTYNRSNINIVNSLNILGVIFDSKFTFKDHCLKLKKNLTARVNIIKYLGSKNSFSHVNTLINIIRSTILAKIDYGLPIYGKCSKSSLKIIEPLYHSAIRISLKAFRSTPITNMLTESGLPSIKDRIDYLTSLVALKLDPTQKLQIGADVKKTLIRKKIPSYPSTISKTICLSKDIGIPLETTVTNTATFPPWLLSNESINTALNSLPKSTTANETYKQMFLEITNPEKIKNWNLIFTDGSKTEFGTAFAVVDENGSTVCKGLLAHFCSVFSAEAIAILRAIQLANNKEIIICTDSLSAISAIKNINNNTPVIKSIRDKLIANENQLKLLWVPGHAGIKGNEDADMTAKAAVTEPLLTHSTFNKKDIKRNIQRFWDDRKREKWNDYTHHYATFNPDAQMVTYPIDCHKKMIRAFIRLRLGHTSLTHSHLLTGNNPPYCLMKYYLSDT